MMSPAVPILEGGWEACKQGTRDVTDSQEVICQVGQGGPLLQFQKESYFPPPLCQVSPECLFFSPIHTTRHSLSEGNRIVPDRQSPLQGHTGHCPAFTDSPGFQGLAIFFPSSSQVISVKLTGL